MKETHGTRREDEDNVTFVRHVEAADKGVSMLWRWVLVLVMIVGFGVSIGDQRARSKSMEDSIADLRRDVSEFRKTYSDLNLQTDRNTRDIAELKELRNEIRELRAQLDTLRNMREAFVYDSAKAARNKLLQQATTPP